MSASAGSILSWPSSVRQRRIRPTTGAVGRSGRRAIRVNPFEILRGRRQRRETHPAPAVQVRRPAPHFLRKIPRESGPVRLARPPAAYVQRPGDSALTGLVGLMARVGGDGHLIRETWGSARRSTHSNTPADFSPRRPIASVVSGAAIAVGRVSPTEAAGGAVYRYSQLENLPRPVCHKSGNAARFGTTRRGAEGVREARPSGAHHQVGRASRLFFAGSPKISAAELDDLHNKNHRITGAPYPSASTTEERQCRLHSIGKSASVARS